MKNIQLISLTSAGTFLFKEGSSIKEGAFQGIAFQSSTLARHMTRLIVGKQIQCSIGKNNSKIRYHNVEFFQESLATNIAKINEAELEQTKVFSGEEKERLRKAALEHNVEKISEVSKQIVDYDKQRSSMPAFFTKNKQFKAIVDYLFQQIWVTVAEGEGLTRYIPLKLRNIDHFFQLVDRVKFGGFLQKRQAIEVTLVSCKFNIAKKQHELEAILPEEVEKMIIAEGWGTVALRNLCFIKPSYFTELQRIEQQAKTSHKGIFSKPFQILSLIYTKNNLVAVVEEIIQGYIFKLRAKNNEVKKVQLGKVYCPIQNQPGAALCRQFARKNLIGREVNVFLTKDEGLNILGSIVRFSDNKDIESLMIENGYAFVKQELKGTMFYAKLETLEKKAREHRKGIHNQKNLGVYFYEDFSQPNSQKKQKLQKKNIIQSKQQFLHILPNGEEGIIDKIIDATTYIIRLDNHKKILKVKLDGVNKLSANPRLPQVQQLQRNCDEYCHRNYYQRTVYLQLNEYNSVANSFIGVIRVSNKGKQKISLQENLLAEGYVYVKSNQLVQDKWVQLQKQATEKHHNIWTAKLRHFIRNDIYEQQEQQFKGKFSWIQDGELAYIHPNSVTQKLDFIYESLLEKQKFPAVNPEDVVVGFVCAAEYLEECSRVRIQTISNKKDVLVKFIDWGNKQTVPIASLRQIPNQLQYVPALCCEVVLDLVQPLRNKKSEHMERLREFLMENEYNFKKSYANIVNVYQEKTHVNAGLVYDAYLKADLSKIVNQELRRHYYEEMEKLRKELAGVWDHEEDQVSDEQLYE